MLARVLAAGVPFAWFTADEDYDQVRALRQWLEARDVPYVVVTRRDDPTTTRADRTARADTLIAELPASAWQRLSSVLARTAPANTTGHAVRSTGPGPTARRPPTHLSAVAVLTEPHDQCCPHNPDRRRADGHTTIGPRPVRCRPTLSCAAIAEMNKARRKGGKVRRRVSRTE
ncbi:MAG: hypothetical protein DLM55_12600 [Acidimicrobiales bacterium]|nr:MAG: hypothetical protein DLM55_12600 [Acidimicrobiales bacterium]